MRTSVASAVLARARWAECSCASAPMLSLIERLRAHEQAESLLLQDFFAPAED
jgi:hypothetical protein